MDLDTAKILIAALGSTGLAIVVFVSFVRVSSQADQHVSVEARRAFAEALLGLGRIRAGGRWPSAFIATFDRVFGERHWSLHCLFRSMIASVLSLSLVGVFFLTTYSGVAYYIRHDLHFYTFSFVIIFAISNLLGDYISLLETRYVIGRMRNMELRQFPLFVVLDLTLTTLIFCLGVEVSWALNTWYANNPTAPHADTVLSQVLQLVTDAYEPWYRMDTLMYFLTALFTSVWIWLFALSWLMTKALSLLQPGLRFLLWVLPVREKPLASVGKVVAVVAAVLTWAVVDVENVLERLEPVSILPMSGIAIVQS